MITLPFGDPIFKTFDSVMAIGVFDGLHLGHMEIINECVRLAKENNAKSVVTTFSVNPKMMCKSMDSMKKIISDQECEYILNNTGVNYHCIIDFSDYISKLSGEEFIARLCTLYNIRAMVVGNSFRCGFKATSVGCDEIAKLLTQYTSSAFLRVVPSVLVDGEVVSSTLIRRCLLTGNFDKASKLLGRTFNPTDWVTNGC